MRKALFILLIVAACSPKQEQPKQDDPKVSEVENSLAPNVYFTGDSLWNIEDRMKFYGVPGVSIAVIENNKIAWSKAYGIMDKETNEPVVTTTLFQAGSISKPVAAYGALKTVEMGKIDLNTDVNSYLTSWKLPASEFTSEKKVTLEHLVSHTGGLTVHGFWGYPEPPYPTLLQVLDGTPPANSSAIRVDKAPETGFRYSGGGYCIMQQMLIDVHGRSFPEIEKEFVLDPLGMINSTYDQPLDSETVKRAATGYLPNHEQTKNKRHVYPEMAAAGLWTTAEDLAKFAIDIQQTIKGESSKVLSQEMAKRMTTPVKNESRIGLGIFIDNRKNSVYFGHGGWDEGFSSELLAHRDKGYGVVVLTNSNHPAFISEVIRAVARVYNWENYKTEYPRIASDQSIFAAVKGRYKNGSDGSITISSEGDKLFIKFMRRKEPVELVRINDSTYVPKEDDNPIRFKENGLVFVNEPSEKHPKVKDTELVPYEYFIAGDYDKALKEYRALMKNNPSDPAISEGSLLGGAENLYYQDQKVLAKKYLRLLEKLYPNGEKIKEALNELKDIPE